MNIAKHMEVIFIAALALVSASTLANAAVPTHRMVQLAASAPAAHVNHAAPIAGSTPMAVVTITAKRLSAAQKAALGN
ncbi:MAG TPA: hypothetical protein VFU95_06225 [Telluria sp.]|nr:hypothetical protein [Telluria sp.]